MDKFQFLEQVPYFLSQFQDENHMMYLFEDEHGKGWINVPLTVYNEIYWEYTNVDQLVMYNSPWKLDEKIPPWFVELVTMTIEKLEKRDRLRRILYTKE